MSIHFVWRQHSRRLNHLLLSGVGCTQGKTLGVRNMATAKGHGSGPWLTATPRVCLHDVPTTLRAGGLPPHAPVTLSASLIDENGREFCSCAQYVTDETGGVDVRTAAAVGGSYTGVFPAGLLTTLAPAPHEVPFIRLYRRNTTLPWKITVSLLDGHQPNGAKMKPLNKVQLERHLMAPGVRRRVVREGRVRGVLYLPPGDGPFPGVIDMFGSVGGIMEFRSAMLASRGFASLALATFAFDDLPANTEHMDMDYFEEAVDLLLAVPGVIPDRCGAIAVSKNGDVLLAMATLLPAVKAVVGINALTVTIGSRLTYKGKLFIESDKPPLNTNMTPGSATPDKLRHEFTLDNPAMIPVEEADEDTHFLMVAGEEDTLDIKYSLAPFRERMLLHNKHNFETILYPGAGHLIEPPYGPHITKSFHKHFPVANEEGETLSSKIVLEWGGQPQPSCAAQEDLWFCMRTFLMNHVREESLWYQEHVARHANTTTKL